MCILTRLQVLPNPISVPLPLPCTTLLRPGFSFCSCCSIICRDGECHWLPHHAGEGPGARGRGGGFSPAVRGAQPDPDVLLGVSEGGDSSWHWERGSPAWHPSSSLSQLLLHFPLGHSSFLGMNMGGFLSLPQCSHTCPHSLPGRMQLPGSPKTAPSLPPLTEPSFFPDTDSPLLWQSQPTCLGALLPLIPASPPPCQFC